VATVGGVTKVARHARTVVFLGPTLERDRATALLPEADIRPPVALGDVHRATVEGVELLGIVDGYYESTPAVWHKELLFALSRGVRCYGAASMGALRAAELADDGMVGIGSIFAGYRQGTLEADDEVAVFHAPSSSGYRRLSEALINIRATCTAAVSAGVVTPDIAREIVAVAQSLHYPDRTWDHVLDQTTRDVTSLRSWLPTHAVDEKRRDALLMLSAMSELLHSRAGSLRGPVTSYAQTWMWRDLVAAEVTTEHRTHRSSAP
jgi:hypothetical protein